MRAGRIYVPRLKVHFGAYNDARYLRNAAEVDDFIVEHLDHFEGCARCNRVDEDVAMDADRMAGVKY